MRDGMHDAVGHARSEAREVDGLHGTEVVLASSVFDGQKHISLASLLQILVVANTSIIISDSHFWLRHMFVTPVMLGGKG